jgi:ribonuclease HI
MRIELWCDGSGTTSGNPGGWAYVLVAIDEDTGEILKQAEGSGGVRDATNNRMEMTALLMGLRALARPSHVIVHADSEYVTRAFTDGWITKWRRKQWRKVKNVDIWHLLVAEAEKHVVEFVHVPGHAGVALNERCDKLAGEARRAMIESLANEEAGVAVVDELQMALHG